MTGPTWARRAGAVRDLQARARRLILAGDLAGAAALAPRAEAAIEALLALEPAGASAEASDLAAIRDAAAHDLRLLAAARDGVLSARSATQRSATAGGRVGYDRGGGDLNAPGAPSRDRRA